ncbi:hypothetical protein [Actinomadura geliboluensis]|uniref:hypothetical protein n=1 Tax=Actinomadura geliboluensis TaxID=882440 RepID=UPI00261C3836|nr:hypothetical protein [Actinomadura geliboluensis]
MAPETLPEVPQDEHALVGRLYPESAWTFVWARRGLRDLVGDRVSRFLVGRIEPGHWSVLRGDDAWLAMRCAEADGGGEARPSHTASFDSAGGAVAYAAAGLVVDANVTVHEDLLRFQGVLGESWDGAAGRLVLSLTDEGERLVEAARDETRTRYGTSFLPLGPVIERPRGYQVIPRGPRPDDGPFIAEHDLFTAHVRARLPGEFGASTGEELPADTLLDTYAPAADEPCLFTLETPFERRGLPGTGAGHERRFYVVRRPLTVYAGFPVRETTVPARGTGPSDAGRGYLLPRPIGALLDGGDIARISEAETLRRYREQRESRQRRDG